MRTLTQLIEKHFPADGNLKASIEIVDDGDDDRRVNVYHVYLGNERKGMFHSYANALEFIEKNGWEREV
jgi:hypothetical protein